MWKKVGYLILAVAGLAAACRAEWYLLRTIGEGSGWRFAVVCLAFIGLLATMAGLLYLTTRAGIEVIVTAARVRRLPAPRGDDASPVGAPGSLRVADDRGRAVPLLSLGLLRPGGGRGNARERALLRRAVLTNIPPAAWHKLAMLATLEVPLLLFATFLVWAVLTGALTGPRGWLYAAIRTLFPLALGWMCWRSLREPYASSVARSCVAMGRCGSCGYGLSGLAPEPDGCTVCPECGSAWRRLLPKVDGCLRAD